jgi:hypothetical protein
MKRKILASLYLHQLGDLYSLIIPVNRLMHTLTASTFPGYVR